MERKRKFETVESLRADFSNATAVFIVHYQGLSVLNITLLRKNLRSCGAKVVIAKNTLAKIAVSGIGYEHLNSYFKGPMALLFSSDPVGLAKTLVEFSKSNDKLQIIAGSVDKEVVNSNEINMLAQLPSLDELRGQLISIISTPAYNLINVLGSSSISIVEIIDEYSKKTT